MDVANPDSSRVIIYDTTLRDGEQAPGHSMSPASKAAIGRALEEAGADVIEAGFPACSDDDMAACRRLAADLSTATLSVLARTRLTDLSRCATAVSGAARSRIHVFSPVSDIHITHKLRSDRGTVLRSLREAVRVATGLADEVQFGCEDATRADEGFLCDAIDAAIDAGAATVTIADTVGYAMPAEFSALVAKLIAHCANPAIRFSVHCHDDLGLAVANSLAGMAAGARQVECTVNGIGERAGNAALEEIAMALRVRADHFHLIHGLHCNRLWELSRLVSAATEAPVALHKAIVGRNAFAHESGIHQHGVIASPLTYEIMEPAEVGAPASRLVIGKHSGKHGLAARLAELGFVLDPNALDRVLAHCKAKGAGEVDDANLSDIVRTILAEEESGRQTAAF